MKRGCLLAVALMLGATFPHAAAPTITIDASTPPGKVSPLLYGLMTEEINSVPDSIPASRSSNGRVDRTRPLCP